MVDAGFGVIRHTLLKEVGLALERDHVHEVEGVGGIVDLLVTKSDEQTVGNKLDVLTHELGVHADKGHGEGIGQELLFDDDGFLDNLLQELGVGPPPKVTEQKAGEVGVHTLVAANQLVGEGEAGHETAFLQPEDGSKGSREEDSLDSGEGNKAFTEGCTIVGDVTKCPVSLLLDTGNGINGAEEIVATSGVLDVCVDEERVRLRVNVFHHDLETVEATRLSSLDLVGETLNEIFVDNAVGCGEESEHVGNEVLLVGVQPVVPVVEILREIHLFRCPEGGFGFLVHLPDLQRRVREERNMFNVVHTSGYWIGNNTKRRLVSMSRGS